MKMEIFEKLMVSSSVYREIDTDQIPFIPFKPDWKVKIIPPFGGATMRFLVERGDKKISVYCDHFGILGLYFDPDGNEVPYWEMYPRTYLDADGSEHGDVMRFAMKDVDKLVDHIERELNGVPFVGDVEEETK